ncbi:alpha/beta hydrolase [Amycolatopsis pithecellobii]|uniref:Alpha/beta fold hydrolase n=1 Tax=Amycolatopsis pithecellobii TaxID=664692 RepID=A0A6N7ZB35_9PSEU|nr:alpha/beta hydrolase [Amycolatopsis pithecellobii]MTD58937.1 alpha/beta fold hydrolase [Amycolatopsis pithecellobii]
MATYVLVHGGGHGGWAWQKVARLLEADGHTVYYPSLTGCGDRAHLISADVDLNTHITDVANLLFYEDLKDVVLVAHSYGGIVITGVADRVADRVAKLVFVDSPRGRSNAEAFPPIVEMRKSGQVVDGVELVVFPSEDLVAFYGVTDPEEVKWMMQRLTPHPWKSIEQKLDLRNETALDTIPRYHIVATSSVRMGAHDNLPADERVAGRFWQIDGPHDLMVTEPQAIAGLLTEIACAPAPIQENEARRSSSRVPGRV